MIQSKRAALALMAVALAACGSASAPEESRSGTVAALMVSHADGSEARAFLLTAADGAETELLFADPPALATGDTITVHGQRTDLFGPLRRSERLQVTGYEKARAQAVIVDPGANVPLRNILIVLFNFKNDDRQYYTTQEIQQRVLTDKDSVRAFYEEQSFGLIKLTGKQNPDGDVTGWHTLDAYDIPCDTTRWANMALEAARGAGVDTTLYQHFIFYFPSSPACDFSGLATIGGRFTWISGASISTMAHEFGHSFGLLHGNSLECRDKNLVRTSMSDDCANVEYGNPFDLMGRGGLRHTNAYNKAVARWLAGNNIVTAEKPGGTFIIAPQEKPSNGPQLLQIPRDAKRSYYLEFRQPFGFDNFAPTALAVNTVMVMLGNKLDGRDVMQSWLIDTTPTTTTLNDAPLALGKTYQDPAAGLSISLLSVNAAGAEVKVEIHDPAVTTPMPDAGAGPDAATAMKPDAAPRKPAPDAAASDDEGDTVGPPTPKDAPRSGCSCALGGRERSAAPLLIVGAALLLRRRRVRALLLALLIGACSSGTTTTHRPPPDDPPDERDAAIPAMVADAARPDVAAMTTIDAAPRADTATPDAAVPTRLVLTVPAAPPALAALCVMEAETQCTMLKQCAPQGYATSYNDDATCRARVQTTCRLNVLDPTRHTTVDAYATCVADLKKRTCLDVYWGRRPASCSPPMGNTAENGNCNNTRDCQLGLTCRFDPSARCGKCVPALMAGDRCSLAPTECVFGTRCVRDECTADLALGAPCKRGVASCGTGLVCTDAGCADKTGVKGTPCGRADVCDPTKNLYCNLATALCDDLPAPTGTMGSTCDTYTDMGYPVRCMAGLYCELNMGTTGGHCRKYALTGEACDTVRGPLCAAPAACSRGLCKVPEIVFSATPLTFPAVCQ